MGSLNYTPSTTIRKFMLSDAKIRAVMGPVGSGKTSGAIMELLRQSILMPPMQDGVRRSRMLIIRNTKQQLKDTTLSSVIGLVPSELYKWRESDMIMRFKFNDVESDWLFRSLDTPEDVQRVLSLEVSWSWSEEAREIPVRLLSDIEGRTGRFPSQSGGFRYRSGIIYTTNPPELDSDHYKLLEGLPQEEGNEDSIIPAHVFKQPSGLSPQAENLDNLRPDYYTELAKGKRQDFVDVYVHGKYAKSMSGRPVYEQSFQYDRRVKHGVKWDAFLPIIIGVDSARHPAAVFMQVGHDGRLRKVREVVAPAQGVGFKTFLAQGIQPLIRNCFSTNPLVFIGDPSWKTMDNTDDTSIYKLLKKLYVYDMPDSGNAVKASETQDPIARINALDEPFRNWWPDGDPGIIYDASCKECVAGLRSKYRYKKIKTGDGEFQDAPQKNHPWSDVVEADQYGTLFALSKRYNPSDYVRGTRFMQITQTAHRPADRYTGY